MFFWGIYWGLKGLVYTSSVRCFNQQSEAVIQWSDIRPLILALWMGTSKNLWAVTTTEPAKKMETDFHCKWKNFFCRLIIMFLKLVLGPVIIPCSNTVECEGQVQYLTIHSSDILITITKDKEPVCQIKEHSWYCKFSFIHYS